MSSVIFFAAKYFWC